MHRDNRGRKPFPVLGSEWEGSPKVICLAMDGVYAYRRNVLMCDIFSGAIFMAVSYEKPIAGAPSVLQGGLFWYRAHMPPAFLSQTSTTSL